MIASFRYQELALILIAVGSFNLAGQTLIAMEPQIHADRSVTFRINAPGAHQVQIDVKGKTNAANDGEPFDMTKNDTGAWTFTTEPLDPGFHYYFIIVDGFRCADSTNPLYFGWQRPTNGIEIPDPNLDCYLPRKVPRGEIRIRPYYSELTEAWREAYVYTPPGYERDLHIETLDERGIRHEFYPHPGTHEWQAWRLHLHLFAQWLFVD